MGESLDTTWNKLAADCFALNVSFAKLDCHEFPTICHDQDILAVPMLLWFQDGNVVNATHLIHDGSRGGTPYGFITARAKLKHEVSSLWNEQDNIIVVDSKSFDDVVEDGNESMDGDAEDETLDSQEEDDYEMTSEEED